MLQVCHGNRMEVLAAKLAQTLADPLPDPLQVEQVVVPHPGMGRWLALRLADELGICANVEFQLPAAFIWKAFRRLFPDLPGSSSFSPELLPWRILAEWDDLLEHPAFAELRAYLDAAGVASRYELAHRVAGVFDQYLLYRPDWIQQWESGAGEHWQARLWRRLARNGADHWVRLSVRFRQELERADGVAQRLPQRVSLFGVPTLSPGYFSLLAELARHMQVRLFVLNPCREYWFDLVPRKRIARSQVQDAPGHEHMESGNRLLASWGRQGQDFLQMIWEQVDQDDACFQVPQRDSLLHCLQADLLELREGDAVAPTDLATDDSLQIHSCHSRMREVEVLHDRLLALFEQFPDLRPSDVVVMAPEVDQYAPYVEAVFGTVEAPLRFPYTIADLSAVHEGRTVEVFLSLLELNWERFELNWVLDLLELPALRARFEIEPEALDYLRESLQEAGIRWGLDAGQRASLDFPAEAHNTWQAGLDRLLLGYAMSDGGDRLYAGIAPRGGMEGAGARALGGLCSLLQKLRQWWSQLRRAQSAEAWAQCLSEMLDDLWDGSRSGPAESQELQLLRQTFATLREQAARAEFSGTLQAREVFAFLEVQLAEHSLGGRFLGGGLTFCRMIPMRSVPFQVVCLLGMDFSSFPRSQHPLGFDAMPRHPRRGDRSRRNDDRGLFLESLICARRCFYLSYVGRDLHENSVIPPSVLVSDLLDFLQYAYRLERAQLLIEHPLQSFSRRYFVQAAANRLYSYMEAPLQMCRTLLQRETQRQEPLFQSLPLPAVSPGADLTLQELEEFFTSPARYFLRRCLRLQAPWRAGQAESSEPFVLKSKQAGALREQICRLLMQGRKQQEIEAQLRAEEILPHGAVGAAALREQWSISQYFQRYCRERELLPAQGRLEFRLPVAGLCLHGTLHQVAEQGLAHISPGRLWPDWKLRWWLRHLVLCACTGEEQQSVALDLSTDSDGTIKISRWSLRAVKQPQELLADLIDVYHQGRRQALHFFPRSSLAYAQARGRRGKQEEDALKSARDQWRGNPPASPGESDNFYYRLAFRGVRDVLDSAFIHLAEQVWSHPLKHELEHD